MSTAAIWLALVVGTAGLLSGPSLASAHTSTAASVPADGSVVAEPPRRLVVTFTSPPARIETAAVHTAGRDLGGAPRLDPGDATRMIVPVQPGPAGRYEAEWRVVAGDGHRVSGGITFTATAPAAVWRDLADLGERLVSAGRDARAQVAAAVAASEQR